MRRIVGLLKYPVWAALVGALIVSGRGFADVWNKKTAVEFKEPVELPGGVVLQPGRYVMKLADSPANRNIVQVFNAEEDHIYATILAIPNYRLTPSDDTVITFHETPAGEPTFMRAWFYPGDSFGQEFAYPKEKARYLARATGTNVPIAPSGDAPVASAVTPGNREVAIEAGRPEQLPASSRAEPPQQAESTTASVRTEEGSKPESGGMTTQASLPKELPATASSLPFLDLGGTLALVVAFIARLIALRQSRRVESPDAIPGSA